MTELITKDNVIQTIERYNCCGYVEEKAETLFEAIADIPSVNSKLHELVVYALNVLNEAWNSDEEEYFLHTDKEY